MARILGIDYGTKRVGLSISDERGMLAFPYGVIEVESPTPDKLTQAVKEVYQKEHIERVVLGVPRGLSRMQDTEMTTRVFSFGDLLRASGISVEFEEEFFTTKEAKRSSSKRGHIDAGAAALILQSYLERKKNMLR